MSRPIVFFAWSSVAGRSNEIAAAIGGESRCYYDLRIARRALVPVRYLLSALRTLGYLVGRRPRALIVTNPPVFVSLLAYPYAVITGATLLLDSHPDAFRTDGPHARFLRIHRSRIVNADRIREVHPWSHGDQLVVLRDGTELIMSRRYRDRLARLEL